MPEKKTAKEIVYETLKKAKKPLSPKEIQKLTGLNYNTIRGRLQDLKKAGLVVRTEEGWMVKEAAPAKKTRKARKRKK